MKITTFLMFEGNAGAAIELYMSLFPNPEIVSMERYGADEGGPEGTVKLATVALNGQQLMFIDSPMKHQFGFTPAISLYVDCNTYAELDALFAGLSAGGSVLMPVGAYPFSKRFGWCSDQFGVSWQLSCNK